MEILMLLLENEEVIDYYYYYKEERARGHRMVFAENSSFCREIRQAKLDLHEGQSNAPTLTSKNLITGSNF
jgi:hypothetical protein